MQPMRFCGVLCIARSVSQPIIDRHAQLTRCFSAVDELFAAIVHAGTQNVGEISSDIELIISQKCWLWCSVVTN